MPSGWFTLRRASTTSCGLLPESSVLRTRRAFEPVLPPQGRRLLRQSKWLLCGIAVLERHLRVSNGFSELHMRPEIQGRQIMLSRR